MKGSGKMFETGEYVVYGRTGICQVTGVTTMRWMVPPARSFIMY